MGSNCDLRLPIFDNDFDAIKESGVSLAKVPKSRIQDVQNIDNKITINIEGGNFDFDIKHK